MEAAILPAELFIRVGGRHLRAALSGSVAELGWDSRCGVSGFGAGDEQACPSDLPHDELACLQRGPEAARLAADLAGSRDGVAGDPERPARSPGHLLGC